MVSVIQRDSSCLCSASERWNVGPTIDQKDKRKEHFLVLGGLPVAKKNMDKSEDKSDCWL